MVKHIIIWNYADGFTEQENTDNGKRIKTEIENLVSLIDGIEFIKIGLNPLPSSNGDICLNSSFQSFEALENYQVHPEHQKVAKFVRSVTKDRRCMDYVE